VDNLVKNALEAIHQGPGIVRVSAESQKQEFVRIVIADNGSGIPEGLDVFALFETTKPNGTGLGLPICKQIVQAHGGGIEYARRLPLGTVFRIELPTNGPTQRL
jgi:signal transduction histidine kinase